MNPPVFNKIPQAAYTANVKYLLFTGGGSAGHVTPNLAVMQERPAMAYVTDLLPDAHAEFEAKVPDRYFSTPKKMGAQTAEANINAGIAAARQVMAYLKNGDETFRVNR